MFISSVLSLKYIVPNQMINLAKRIKNLNSVCLIFYLNIKTFIEAKNLKKLAITIESTIFSVALVGDIVAYFFYDSFNWSTYIDLG